MRVPLLSAIVSARRSVPRRPVARARLLPILLAVALGGAGCNLAEPGVVPQDPPPNVPANLMLLALPPDEVAAISREDVRISRDVELARDVTMVGGRAIDEARKDLIRRHVVVTGMSAEEVIWCFEAHPIAVREQGPPGSHTLFWDPRGRDAGRRYWVRFDGWGYAIAAGRY